MLSSHKVCPVCKKEVRNIPRINKYCAKAEQTLSFVESICNNVNWGIETKYPHHMFFQVSSLYEEMMCQSIEFPDKNYKIEVNYVLYNTQLTYFNKPDIHCVSQPGPYSPTPEPPKLIVLKNRLVDLDYPELTTALKKIKTLALFL